ncbi:fibronectin type III domain-containing protein [Rouxiella sp. T17]|uniref:fibronectin type III domain-containing protein n=1 Tax=Rouxiella sp. T17 TaxID=3085684 RepID=UPI002FCBEE99
MALAVAVPAILAGISAAAAVYSTIGLIGAIIVGVSVAALSYISTSAMMKVGDTGTQYPSTSASATTSRSPSTGISIIYGGQYRSEQNEAYIKTGSIIADQNVYNDVGDTLCTVHCVSVGEVQNSIAQLYFDNVAVLVKPITSEGIVTSDYLIAKFRPYLQLEVRFGKSSYSNGMSLAKQYCNWTDDYRGDGLVQICVVIKKTEDSLIDGILTNLNYSLSVLMKGKIINDLTDNSQKATSNPPSILYDFLTNSEYGFGLSTDTINLESFQVAAQYCNSHGLFANGTISYTDSFKQNVENILSTFAGILYESFGELHLAIDTATLPSHSFNESNIIGTVSLTTGGIDDYINCIDATYTDPSVTSTWVDEESDDYDSDDLNGAYSSNIIRYPSNLYNSDVLKRDGRVIKKDNNYTWVQDPEQLAFLCNSELLKSKYSQSSLSFITQDGMSVSVWDVISVTFAELGFVNKKYRIISKEIPLAATDIGQIQLTCVEYYDEVYSGTDAGILPIVSDNQLPSATYVAPPTNLIVRKSGTTTSGGVVVLSWTASQDSTVTSYGIRYKKSSDSTWINAGSVNKYNTSYSIYNLDSTVTYDFGVCAYNTIGYASSLLTITGTIPQLQFDMPSVTNLHLVNNSSDLNTTDGTDFNIAWDVQTSVKVNDRLFSDYFKYYEVRVYNSAGTYLKSYYTTSNSFSYTFDMNKADGLGRKRTFGLVAWGQDSATFSQEIQLTVKNDQAPLLQGFVIKSGIDSVFVSWDDSNQPSDYGGILLQCSASSDFSSGVQYFDSTARYSASFNLVDGQYYVRCGMTDVFGYDDIKFTAALPFNQNSTVPYSKLANDTVDHIISDSKFNDAVTQIITDESDTAWYLSVNNNNYVSGIAIKVDGVEQQSVFTVVADRFSIISSATAGADTKIYPFVVQNGTTYIQNAMIQNGAIGTAQINDLSVTASKIGTAAVESAKIATGSILNYHLGNGQITNAKISGLISSDNYVAGTSGWAIDKNGGFDITGTGGGGRVQINGDGITIYDASGVLKVKLGRLS